MERSKKEIQNLIREYQRRWQKLKETQARYGIATAPQILTEIEDIETEIDRLQAELKDKSGVAEAIPNQENEIAREIRYALPNATYSAFVANYLLPQQSEDPFALDVPERKMEDIYVSRDNVEKNIATRTHQIILGSAGSGKTTFCKMLPTLLGDNSILITGLPLTEIGLSMPEEVNEREISLFTPDILIRYIFTAYLKNLLYNPNLLLQWHKNQQWLTKLHWFYHYYSPALPYLGYKFKLVTRLNLPLAETAKPKLPPVDVLRELVEFVTYPPYQTFTEILVLIDSADSHLDHAIPRLIQDFQKFYNLNLTGLHFKLFIDSAWQKQVESMDKVRQGRIAAYYLPPWQSIELQNLLYRRLIQSGEFLEKDDWSKRLSAAHLSPAAQIEVIKIIINGAIRAAAEKKDGLDAPAHALRLARGLVAACAGCWKEQFPPPLTTVQLNELVNIYITK